MSQNIADESQTTTEQPTSADFLGKMSEAIETLLAAQEKLVQAAADVAKHTTDPNAHGAATLANIIKALPKPILEDGMFSFKDADGNDIIDPVNLKGDTGEKGEKGDDGAKGDKGDMPDHQWNGTSLQMQKPDGTWGEAQDLRGPKGEDGINGTDGAPGQAPAHEWNGTTLKFKNPDGTWGEEQSLQGPKGEDGSNGAAPEHEWNGTSLKFKNPDGTWGEEQNLQGPQGAPGDAAIATAEQPGIVQPDGVTTAVDEDGLLSALGGNLLLNSEVWLTESGTFTAPVRGWYDILLIAGGSGGNAYTGILYAGASGEYKSGYVYLEEGEEVAVTIGAGGLSYVGTGGYPVGGETAFGTYLSTGVGDLKCYLPGETKPIDNYSGGMLANGGGFGAKKVGYTDSSGAHSPLLKGLWYGAGGGCTREGNTNSAGDGYQGAIRARWHDPAKAAGPLPAPALFAARRMAPSAAAAPATVNLYDPETGQGSVWREEDAEAKLAEGLISEAAWLEIRAAKAAEEYAAWLADPETEAERFEMLRMACEAKLAETDKLVQPDYPISEESRAEVVAYRQSIRELNHQQGAPWDGGGELTPWPEAPTVSNAQVQPDEPEQTEEPEV